MTAGGVGGEGLLETVTRSPVAEGLATGIGARVIVFGTLVMIPGFSGT